MTKKESNERYDIVAKATSDTIWDWKIQEDDLLSNGKKSIFGYEKHQVGDSSKWWFDNIHLKTASKCLLNYIYRTKPTIGKMNTALNVLTTPINTYLIEGFF
jgi:hypothetical protein